MAYTRAQVRDLIRQKCNLENTTSQVDTEINNHINDAAAYTHDFLIATWGERYDRRETTVPVVAGTIEYTLSATDFYKPIRVAVTFNDLSYPIGTFSWSDTVTSTAQQAWDPNWLPRYSMNIRSDGSNRIEFLPVPAAAATVRLTYHPVAPVYTADSGANGTVSIPHVDLLIMEACIRVKDKDERESARLMQERALIQKRIEDWVGTADLANVEQTQIVPRTRRMPLPDGRLF